MNKNICINNYRDINNKANQIIIKHKSKGLNSLHIYFPYNKKKKIMNKNSNSDSISRDEVKEMIENALRRHNRRSTIISSVLGWILIGGYSFGLFQAVQNV